MARLPQPGADDGVWGGVLNDFLLVAHNSDGTLQNVGILATKAADSTVVHNTGSESVSGTKAFSTSPTVPTPTLGSQAANKTYVDSVVSAGAPDATTSTKGIVQLAGDLGGTGTAAAAPIISDGAITNAKVSNSAAIAQSKLNLAITDTEVASGANIAQSKISGLAASLAAKTDKATLTTKGDIYAATAASTPARLGVGSDGQVLTADSSQATGIKWAPAGGSNSHTVVSKTSAYTATTSDEVILVSASGGAVTITLPTAVGNSNFYSIKKTDSSGNFVTIDTTSSQTIDGGLTAVIKVQYASVTVVSNGANWFII